MLISLLIYVLTSLTGSRTLGQVNNLLLAQTKNNISISNVTRRNTGETLEMNKAWAKKFRRSSRTILIKHILRWKISGMTTKTILDSTKIVKRCEKHGKGDCLWAKKLRSRLVINPKELNREHHTQESK